MLADGFVQVSAALAVEVIFKTVYSLDIERFRYQMEERVTSFDPPGFTRILGNYVQPPENVELSYLVTDTFRSSYKAHGVEARTIDGQRLGIPNAFARLAGFQVS
jgi:hypothetical protein